MKKRVLALSAAMLIILGAGTANAGDTVLYTPMLTPPVGGSLECHVTNVGKKRLPEVRVGIYHHTGGGSTVCSDLSSVRIAANGHTCSRTTPGTGVCEITITGGSYRSVRAVLNVVDSGGGTILSVPATK
jgi:hypothetical protein